MNKKYIIPGFFFIILFFCMQNCLTDSKKNPDKIIKSNQNSINETFHHTGWISEIKYRTVVFVITEDEIKSSSLSDIEEKIKLEAFKNLQKDLNPNLYKVTSIQIKNLVDNFGKLTRDLNESGGGKTYFYDIEKKDLKSDFEKIKNLKY